MRSAANLNSLPPMMAVRRVGKNLAADLHAGIQQRVAFVFQFQLEIFKRLRRAKKTVARAGNRFAGEHAVLNRVFGLAAVLGPAVEVFAVEQIDPAVLRGNRRTPQEPPPQTGVKMVRFSSVGERWTHYPARWLRNNCFSKTAGPANPGLPAPTKPAFDWRAATAKNSACKT